MSLENSVRPLRVDSGLSLILRAVARRNVCTHHGERSKAIGLTQLV
jgi:hypothetical protein